MKLTKKLLIAIMTIALFFVTGCGSESDVKDSPVNKATSDGDNQEKIPQADSGVTSENPEQEEVKGIYSDNEVYTGDDGKEYSKTEDGTEVEITGDNFQTLMEEYEKVKGTGSEREKELLDQLQVIMDIVSAKSPQ